MSLADAIDAVVAETGVVSAIRSDPVIGNLIKTYKRTVMINLDQEALSKEMSELSIGIAFDSRAFPLGGTGGLKAAKKSRIKIQASRDRLIAIEGGLRKSMSLTARVLRVGMVYLRQNEVLAKMTARHTDAICEVSLREIVENQETMKMLSAEAKEALGSVDSKNKTLDSWFNLHKQYVYMTGANRGPRGEQETYSKASKQQAGKLGKKKSYQEDE